MTVVDDIQHRLDKIPPGPWTTNKYHGEGDMVRQVYWIMCPEPGHSDCAIAQAVHLVLVRMGHPDNLAYPVADFIAHAPEDIKLLLAERAKLSERVAELEWERTR